MTFAAKQGSIINNDNNSIAFKCVISIGALSINLFYIFL